MKKITALLLMVALFGTTLGSVFARTNKINSSGEKVNFDFKMNDAVGSNAGEWEKAFEEAAAKEGYEVTASDDEDSVKVTVYIGKDDADDDNDGTADTADKDDDGDGIEDAKQNVEEYDLDKEVPQLLEEGKDVNKNEGVYFAVVGENGKMNVFRSDVDDFSFSDDSASTLPGGAFFRKASFSPNASTNRAFPVLLALRVGFQVAKIGYQVYKIAKKK